MREDLLFFYRKIARQSGNNEWGAGVGLEPRDKLSRVRSSGSDDLYSPSGGARGGGLKVLAKAGGTAPPLGEYKLLENCKCYQGPELDAAA